MISKSIMTIDLDLCSMNDLVNVLSHNEGYIDGDARKLVIYCNMKEEMKMPEQKCFYKVGKYCTYGDNKNKNILCIGDECELPEA